MTIVDDPANDVSIDLHFIDEQGEAWLEIRNDEAVIKRFKNRCSVTEVEEEIDLPYIKQIILAWVTRHIIASGAESKPSGFADRLLYRTLDQ